MEIISLCVFSAVFGVAKTVIMIVFILQPQISSSSLILGINECFERVSIGKRLSRHDITRSVANTTLRQCDVACEREICNAYAYGIGPTGNSTCEISLQLPKSPPNEDADYDLFLRVIYCRDMIMCFERMVNGRKLIDRYIRRTFRSDSLSKCQLACSIEREFICEGFNYRFGTSPEVDNSCQLTAMPGMNLDLTSDFTSDVDYDFYTRDRKAPAACGFLSYKTWNFAPQSQNTPPYGPKEWWRKTTPLPNDQSVQLQSRVHHNDIYNNKWNSHGYECFLRARTGFRLHRQVVVMTLNAPTLYDCEFVCANERKFLCNVLSYRYSSTPSTDNCMLGEKTIKQLEIYSDLVPERDFDVYIRNELSQPGCQPKRTRESDCFERVRTGIRINPELTRFAVNTDSLIDCELICLHIRHFTCRSFSFKYGPKSNGHNCLLTDRPIPEMDPRRHYIEDSSCELYHRGSYGHGCEMSRNPYGGAPNFVPLDHHNWNPSTQKIPPMKPIVVTVTSSPYPYTPYGHDNPIKGSTSYSTLYDPTLYLPATGKPYLPPRSDYPSSLPKFRPTKPPRLSASSTIIPSTKSQTPWVTMNTQGFEYEYGNFGRPKKPVHSHKLDKICYIAYGSPGRLRASAITNSVVVVNEQECKAECTRGRETSKFRCSTISYWSGHCELSEIEFRDLKKGTDFAPHDSYWLFSWDFTNPHCYSSGATPAVISRADGVWSSYTVSGRRCRWGAQCSHWNEAGIWMCPVENGDWDYCCRPDHHCGYSEGYSYPWCYVGSLSKEQWRPCNDGYYPYNELKRGVVHWPISYVHQQGPPNSTGTWAHKSSSVDNFLESLSFDQEGARNAGLKPRITSSTYSQSNSSTLEFQIVDVTENLENIIHFSAFWPTDNNSSANLLMTIQAEGHSDKIKRRSQGNISNVMQL